MTPRLYWLSIFLTPVFWLGLASQADASYPASYNISVDQSAQSVTLLGKGDDSGKSTVISLPSRAKKIQGRKLRVAGVNYLGVLYQKKRGVYLRFYHPNGNKLAQRTVATRKGDQAFPAIRLDSVVISDRRMAKVTLIKQTSAGINKRFISKRYQVKPKKTGNKQLAVYKSKSEVITAPTFNGDNWLAMLNYYRKASGVTPVSEDVNLSADCQLHNSYMELNSELTHYETDDKPGYSEDGARAGISSVLTSWWSTEKRDAVSGWFVTLYHRLPLLDPAIDAPGFDDEFNRNAVSYYCLYFATYDTQLSGIDHEPIAFPFPGMTDVETSLTINESPDPLEPHLDEGAEWPTGPIITLQFYNGENVSSMSVSLIDSNGVNLTGYKQLPGDSDNPNNAVQGNAVSFIPKNPLNTNTLYTVRMTGDVDATSFNKTWSFTTGS